MADTNDAADFAASLAAAAGAVEEQGMEPETNDSPADADASDGESSDDESAVLADDSEGDDADAGDDDEGSEDESQDSGDASVESIRELFLNGDKDEALKALGLDPKVLDVNGPKLKAMREGLKNAKEAEARGQAKLEAGVQAEERAKSIIADGKARYGHLVDLKLALKAGDFSAAKDILEDLAPEGTSYRQIAEGIAKAAQGMSPSETIYRKKLRDMAKAEREAEEAKQAEKAKPKEPEPAALAQKNLDGAKALLAKTVFSDIPGAAEALVKLAAENWDPAKKGLKVPKEQLVKLLEKDPVVGQLLELKKLKARNAAPSKTPKGEEAPRGSDGKFKRLDRRTTAKVDTAQKEKDEFAAAMAEATRMEAQQRRAKNAGKGRR